MKPKDLQHLTDAEIAEKARKAQREYMREYRKRPGFKERNRDHQRSYWARRALKAEAANNK